MADENIVIGVSVQDRGASANARRVAESIDDIGGSARDARFSLDPLEDQVQSTGRASLRAATASQRLQARLKALGREASKTAAKFELLNRAKKRLDKLDAGTLIGTRTGRHAAAGADAAPGGDTPGGADRTKQIVKAGMQLRGLRIVFLLAAIASAIPAAVAGIASLGAALIGLAGALGPLTGLIVAYPGYLAAFGQAFATVKIGLSGMGEAIKSALDPAATAQEFSALKREFSSLGKEFTGQFIRNISVAKRELDGMKSAIQQALLPSIDNLVNSARALFPTIATGLASTGAAIGSVINQFAATINTGAFAQQLSQLMGSNTQIISSFGSAALSGFKALMDILVAASPMLRQIAADIANMFQTFSSNIASNAGDGGLASFFEKTYAVAKQVVQIFVDVGAALKNIATIGQPLGQAILDSFSAIADGFRDFTESGDGINQIRQWFIDMAPVIYELGYLIRDVIKALFGLSNPEQFMQISLMLRQDMLPVLVSVIEHFSLLVPSLLQIATAALEMFNVFQQLAPVEVLFQGFATVLTLMAQALTWLASGPLGAIGTALFFMAGAAAGIRILAAAFLFLMRMFLGTALFAAIKGVAIAIMAFGTTASTTAIKVTVLSAALRVLGVALRSALIASGIGIVLVGIGLLFEAILNLNGSVDDQIAANEAWAQSLFDVNGQLNENAGAITANAIAAKDYIGTLEGMGIYTADVVAAVTGSDDAYTALIDSLMKAADAEKTVTIGAKGASVTYSELGKTLLGVVDDVTGMRNSFLASEKQAQRTAGAIGESATAMDELALATQSATNYLQRLNGWLGILGSNASWRQSITGLQDALKEDTSFKRFTEAGEKNLAALRGAVEQSLEKVQQLYEGGNVKGAERVLQKRIAMLKDIMLELPKEDRKPFQQMLDRLMTGRRRFDRQLQAMMNNPVSVEVPVEMKLKADIRTGTGDIPQSVLQGMPDISTTKTETINVNTTQVDAAQGKVDTLNSTVSSIGEKSFAITVHYPSLSQALIRAGALDRQLGTISTTPWKITMTAISLFTAVSRAQTLKRELIALTSKPWIVNVEYKESGKRATGGPVSAGSRYTVGERGPEMFVGSSGRTSMIGVSGQEQRTFVEDGFVVPNHALPEVSSSSGVMSREYQMTGSSPVINIGTVNAKSEIDVVRAVKKGIAEAERSRKERS